MAATTTAGVPKVEEVQTLSFHQTDVDQQIVKETRDKCDDKPDYRLGGNKLSLLFLNFAHFPIFLLIDLNWLCVGCKY